MYLSRIRSFSFTRTRPALGSIPFVRAIAMHRRTQQTLEGRAKLHVEHRVDQRIASTVEIAEPENERRNRLGKIVADVDERRKDIDEEERKPAEKKDADDDAERSRETTFARQRDLLPFVHQRGQRLALEQTLTQRVLARVVRLRRLGFVHEFERLSSGSTRMERAIGTRPRFGIDGRRRVFVD